MSKPLSSCAFVSLFFFHQPQRHCCGSQALEIHSVCRVSYGIADNHRNTMCSLITVSVLQEIFRGARAPLSGIVLAEPHWFPPGPIPLSKMCLMTFLFCPLRSHCTYCHALTPTQLLPACDITFLACRTPIVFLRMQFSALECRRLRARHMPLSTVGRGSEGGRKQLCILYALHSNGHIFNPATFEREASLLLV